MNPHIVAAYRLDLRDERRSAVARLLRRNLLSELTTKLPSISITLIDITPRLVTEDTLLGDQKSLLNATATHEVTVCEKSRRTGATWGIAAEVILTSAAVQEYMFEDSHPEKKI